MMPSEKVRLWLALCAGSAALAVAGGCGREADTHTSHAVAHTHDHPASHGGTVIVLGDEAYHLELVLDRSRGVLQAYVLDGEMESFVRVAMPAFEMVARIGDETHALIFSAVADPATGERVGDTSLFEAKAEWLKAAASFDAVLSRITIREAMFANVALNFPRGNE